jgi:hypothetical protein
MARSKRLAKKKSASCNRTLTEYGGSERRIDVIEFLKIVQAMGQIQRLFFAHWFRRVG